jgi:hypothetical protein
MHTTLVQTENIVGLAWLQTSVWLEFDFEFDQIENVERCVASLTLKRFDLSLKVWLRSRLVQVKPVPNRGLTFAKDLKFDLDVCGKFTGLTQSIRRNLALHVGETFKNVWLLLEVCFDTDLWTTRQYCHRKAKHYHTFRSAFIFLFVRTNLTIFLLRHGNLFAIFGDTVEFASSFLWYTLRQNE